MDGSWKWLAIGGAAAVAVGLVAFVVERSRRQAGAAFAQRVGHMVAEWYSQKGRADRSVVKGWFDRLFAGAGSPPPFPLARLDVVLEKKTPGDVRVEVVIDLPAAETAGPSRLTLASDFAWHDLPEQYREEFLRSGNPRLTYTLWPVETGNGAPTWTGSSKAS